MVENTYYESGGIKPEDGLELSENVYYESETISPTNEKQATDEMIDNTYYEGDVNKIIATKKVEQHTTQFGNYEDIYND